MSWRPTTERFGVKLTDQQALFVDEYVIDLNVKRAARAAGFVTSNAGHAARKHPAVSEAISRALDERMMRANVRADEVILELKRMAFSNVADAFDEKNRLKPIAKMSAELQRCLSGVEITEVDGVVKTKVKFTDRVSVLTLLCKHLGLISEKVEVAGAVSLYDLLGAARKPKDDEDPTR
jgi:phage terminase small subunit